MDNHFNNDPIESLNIRNEHNIKMDLLLKDLNKMHKESREGNKENINELERHLLYYK